MFWMKVKASGWRAHLCSRDWPIHYVMQMLVWVLFPGVVVITQRCFIKITWHVWELLTICFWSNLSTRCFPGLLSILVFQKRAAQKLEVDQSPQGPNTSMAFVASEIHSVSLHKAPLSVWVKLEPVLSVSQADVCDVPELMQSAGCSVALNKGHAFCSSPAQSWSSLCPW